MRDNTYLTGASDRKEKNKKRFELAALESSKTQAALGSLGFLRHGWPRYDSAQMWSAKGAYRQDASQI